MYIWRSWFNILALKNKNLTYRESFLALEIVYMYDRRQDPKHPGDDVIVSYHVQVTGGWHELYSEKTSLAVWKHACFTANLVTGLMSFSTGLVSKNITIAEMINSKNLILDDWDRSHLWSMADTISEINIFKAFMTETRCGDAGDLIPWKSPYWSFENKFPQLARRKMLDEDFVCGKGGPTSFTVTIPVQPTFLGAVQSCKLLGTGSVSAYSSFPEWTQALRKAREDIGHFSHMWFSWVRINGSFVSFYKGNVISNIIWRPGCPDGKYDCIYCQDNGCAERDCQSDQKANFQCIFEKRPILFLRGLCASSNLDKSYYPDNRIGNFMWVGIEKTFIMFNFSNNTWIAKIKNHNTWATIETSIDSLLLGTQEWIIHNDYRCFSGTMRKVKLNLSYCTNAMFSCDDGTCINLDMKCNENIDCPDGTDEIGCKVVNIPVTYNKAVTSDSEKFDLSTSVEILNILSITEMEGKIRLTVRLILEWYDSRLTFLDLKSKTVLNKLEDTEFDLIWTPDIIFVNIEKKDFEYSVKSQVTIIMNASQKYDLADYSSLYSSKIYNGNSSKINWRSDFR